MRLKQEGRVALYGIDYKDKREEARRLLAQLGDPYRRIGFDRDGRRPSIFGVYGVPETYVVDKEGHIRYRQVGPDHAKGLRPQDPAALEAAGGIMVTRITKTLRGSITSSVGRPPPAFQGDP